MELRTLDYPDATDVRAAAQSSLRAIRGEIRLTDRFGVGMITALTSTSALFGGATSPAPVLWSCGPWGAAVVLLLASTFAIGAAVSGCLCVAAMCAGRGKEFVGVPSPVVGEPSTKELVVQAIEAAETVAVGRRRIRRGVPWFGLSSAAAFVWSFLGAVTG